MCPQRNVIFPLLTVMEHLRFFASIKGVPVEQAESVLVAVGLAEKRNVFAKNLSGGEALGWRPKAFRHASVWRCVSMHRLRMPLHASTHKRTHAFGASF